MFFLHAPRCKKQSGVQDSVPCIAFHFGVSIFRPHVQAAGTVLDPFFFLSLSLSKKKNVTPISGPTEAGALESKNVGK